MATKKTKTTSKKSGGLTYDSAKKSYVRSLGWVRNEGGFIQPKFRLGPKLDEAETRNQRLEQLWRCVVEEWEKSPDVLIAEPTGTMIFSTVCWPKYARAVWHPPLLEVARAVSRGETSYAVPRQAAPQDGYLLFVADLNRQFPAVLFRPADQAAYASDLERHAKGVEHVRQRLQEAARFGEVTPPQSVAGPRLHDALDEYVAELEKEAHLSQWNRTRANQAMRLRDRHEDMPLSALDIMKVEEMVKLWKNRPKVKARGGELTDRQMALTTCRNHLIQLNHFFRWLHRHPGYAWRLPDGFEDIDDTPRAIDADRAAKRRALHVETYTADELAVLYGSASPLMRLFILLGLNCGFIAAETGTLVEEGEIFLGQRHPESGNHGIVSSDQDNWIRRVRVKNGVYGEWKLWPHTVAALRWAVRRRRGIESALDALIVTAEGTSYCQSTSGGNKNSRVRNLWVSFIEKVQAKHPGFRYLPFKQLRKTGGQLVRRFGDGETQGIFLCHGKPVKNDDLADIYSNRPFFRVFETLDKVENHLAPMWAACPNPFGRDED